MHAPTGGRDDGVTRQLDQNLGRVALVLPLFGTFWSSSEHHSPASPSLDLGRVLHDPTASAPRSVITIAMLDAIEYCAQTAFTRGRDERLVHGSVVEIPAFGALAYGTDDNSQASASRIPAT